MMITSRQNAEVDKLLLKTASLLDIPDHIYEDATLKYEDIGNWLGAEDSDLADYTPDIYVQGSFRLGTVVRPITERDEYDIDLVCNLAISKENMTQKDLKEMVGLRLKKRNDLNVILKPSRRCWTLEYPTGDNLPSFHMDVLPAIPNIESRPTGILLTDTELKLWQKSNPKAYAEWFYERMKVIFRERRAAFAETIKAAAIEDVPEWQVKTPLQTAVQILKRHRDIYFQDKQEVKPISIIITTLAAASYDNQPSVYDALINMLLKIETNWGRHGYVEYRSGKWWVVNPVDEDENFADKWNEYPERREAFLTWLKKVHNDLDIAITRRNFNESVETLAPALGKSAIFRAAQDMGKPMNNLSLVPVTKSIQVPALGDIRHCHQPQWPINIAYKANINASVYLKEYAKKKLWGLTDRSVPKKVWLRFSVTTNVPSPYDVRWQIVNTGLEATEAKQLRGDFYESDKGLKGVRWEYTAYVGTHWVEAFVIKNGVCVARSGRKYVKIR